VAVEDISIRLRKIILTEMNNHITNTDLTIFDVSAIRKCIYYARKKSFPSNPKSVSDVHIALNDLHLTTSKNEDFLFINDVLSNLNIVCKSETIYIDGTFSYCPKYFVQFFVIHGFINEYYVPTISIIVF